MDSINGAQFAEEARRVRQQIPIRKSAAALANAELGAAFELTDSLLALDEALRQLRQAQSHVASRELSLAITNVEQGGLWLRVLTERVIPPPKEYGGPQPAVSEPMEVRDWQAEARAATPAAP